MKTIVLPGFSEHNKDWAIEMSKRMNLEHQVIVHEWLHWTRQAQKFSLNYELRKIEQEIGKEKINIVAKSVGVYVALNLIPKISSQINKVILCGIASAANEDRKNLIETLVSKVPYERILCVQNIHDKYVSFKDAEKFYHLAEPKLKVVSKPRSDHEYPYPEDFREFLLS